MTSNEDRDARWDRDMKATLANLRADELLRAVGRLEREWRAYQRQFAPPPRGQLDLFTDAR
jgi:hypothetical protein